jgi:hypothetical protein
VRWEAENTSWGRVYRLHVASGRWGKLGREDGNPKGAWVFNGYRGGKCRVWITLERKTPLSRVKAIAEAAMECEGK